MEVLAERGGDLQQKWRREMINIHQSLRAAAAEAGTVGAFTALLTSSRKIQPEDDSVSSWTFAPPLFRRCDVLLF